MQQLGVQRAVTGVRRLPHNTSLYLNNVCARLHQPVVECGRLYPRLDPCKGSGEWRRYPHAGSPMRPRGHDTRLPEWRSPRRSLWRMWHRAPLAHPQTSPRSTCGMSAPSLHGSERRLSSTPAALAPEETGAPTMLRPSSAPSTQPHRTGSSSSPRGFIACRGP